MSALHRYRTAQRLFRERRFTAAARELEHLLAERPLLPTDRPPLPTPATAHAEHADLADAPLLLARAYYRSNQLARAEAVCRALAQADESDVYAVLLLSRTLQRRGRHADAGTWLRRLDAIGYDTWSDEFSPVTSDEPSTPPRPARTHAA